MTTRSAVGHLHTLDVLRGLSALAVVLFHVRVDLWVGWREITIHPLLYSGFDRVAAYLTVPSIFMGEAVMMFFILSGFCIHWPHAVNHTAPTLITYAKRRFFRIYPPYLAAVFVSVAAGLAVHSLNDSPASTCQKAVECALMVQNYAIPRGQLAGNPSLWSLPIEVELYALYPCLHLLWRQFGTMVVTGVIASSAAVLAFLSYKGEQWVLGSSLGYILIWCSGAFLAEITARGKLPAWSGWHTLLATTCLLVAVISVVFGAAVVLQHYIWAGLFLIVLIRLITNPFRFWSHETRVGVWLAALGTISYSLYLVHFPLFHVCGAVWFASFGGKPSNALVPLVFCGLAIPVACAFYRLFEAPSHQFARGVNASSVRPNRLEVRSIGSGANRDDVATRSIAVVRGAATATLKRDSDSRS